MKLCILMTTCEPFSYFLIHSFFPRSVICQGGGLKLLVAIIFPSFIELWQLVAVNEKLISPDSGREEDEQVSLAQPLPDSSVC